MRFHLTSKTVLGALVSCLGYLAQPDVFAVLPKHVAAVVTVAGVILSAIGVRSRLDVVQDVATDAGVQAQAAAALAEGAARHAETAAATAAQHMDSAPAVVGNIMTAALAAVPVSRDRPPETAPVSRGVPTA